MYSVGLHRLKVIFSGSSQTTPLVLESLVIQNGSVPTVPTSSTSSGAQVKSTNTPAIIGGVAGSVAFLIIAVLVFIWFRRRQRNCGSDKNVEVLQRFDPAAPPLSPRSAWGMSSLPQFQPFTTTRSDTSQLHSSSPSHGTQDMQSGSNFSESVVSNHLFGSSRDVNSAPRPAKIRETEAKLTSQATSESHHLPTSDSSTRMIHHTDSGVRFRAEPPQVPVVDLPPEYTPS